MKKLKLKSWVETTLISWFIFDISLLALALYMQKIYELGL